MEIPTLDLLKALQWPSASSLERPTYSNIAAKFGVSEWAIRSRLKKLRLTGVIRDIKVVPKFPFIGLEMSPRTYKHNGLEQETIVSMASNISWLYSLHFSADHIVLINIIHRGRRDLQDKENFIKNMGLTPYILYNSVAISRGLRFTLSELRILKELLISPFVSSKEISSATGIDKDNVEKNILKLAKKRAFSLRIAVNSNKIEGGVIFAAILTTDLGYEAATADLINSMQGNDIYNVEDNFKGIVIAMGYAKTFERIQLCKERLASLNHVSNVEIYFPVNVYPNSDEEILNAINRKIWENNLEMKTKL